ncbi:MAG: hypothetical protein CL583_13505 [Alteromonadaceae bacterium]|nr:hypothetical protein [Alteromonadaceae bacterium]|tara:strand:- start:1934 stop:2290 length:357 start_codon:yes stop_codon:yes gene_type:complete
MKKKLEIEVCELCGKPMSVHSNRVEMPKDFKTYGKNGLIIDMGYSIGGWGYRRDAVSFGEEVCDECFEAAQPVYDAIQKFLADRRGREGDQVRTVWHREPPPERRGASVLRALPSFRG